MIPLLSILIATKNRQKYCLSAVESILMLPDTNIQVIVQDNSDDTNLIDMLTHLLKDSRLIYRYTPPPFSSIDNFNAAIELATGEYVCLIGDDDGINPEIIKATTWAKENNIDCLVGNLKANYRWENTGEKQFFHLKISSSSLVLGNFNGKAKLIDTKQSLEKLVQNGCTNYMDFAFPKLYHGIVKKEILDELKFETGAYLKGLSPDIYAAIALAFKIKKFVTVDYPLSIPGVCTSSSSIQEGEQKTNSKELESAPHLRDRKEPYIWEINVPRIYCVQTIWADSAFAAFKEFKQTELLKDFDKYMLCVKILEADRSLEPMVFDFLVKAEPDLSLTQLRLKVRLTMLRGPYKKLIVKIFNRVKLILGLERFKVIENLPNIVLATNSLEAFLKGTEINLLEELNEIKKI